MKNVLIWLTVACSLSACMDPAIDDKLKLTNTTSNPILVVYTVDDPSSHALNGIPDFNPFHEFQEADSTRGYQAGLLKDNPNYIAPGRTISAHLGMGRWEDHIGKGKLRIYLFNPETVLNSDWDKIRLAKKWDKLYSFTLEQVEAQNWHISL